jgi:hypothetical protein
MTDWAVFNITFMPSLEASPAEVRTSLTILFTLVLVALLRKRLISFWRARLIADL